ncbi:26S proteasome subunit rpt4 [Apiospora marii]|uniref:26S proteasome subunit rpt4 n=1 Tax=Apiospora marii TaxID=335849 RepID=UPI00313174F7
MASDQERDHALQALRNKLIESREWEAKLKALRLEIKGLAKDYDQTEDNIKALQSVGQIIGEVLKQLDEERFIVKASSGPRYVVGCRSKVDKAKGLFAIKDYRDAISQDDFNKAVRKMAENKKLEG